MLRPHETADKWIVDDGERAGMDYYGEARCMVGLVLERGEERRRLASRKARITSQVSRMTWEVSIMYHVWVGRRARTDRRDKAPLCRVCGAQWCMAWICWEVAENLWPTSTYCGALDHVDSRHYWAEASF